MSTNDALDLVLINPGNPKQTYQSLAENKLTAIEPPVWAGLMASFVRLKGYSVAILDANALGLTPAEAVEQVANMNPVLTAVVVYGHQPSASTQNMPAASAATRALKERLPANHVLMLGGHVASLPERTLEEEACDYTCRGEGLDTLIDLIETLKANNAHDLSKVRGLCYQVDGKVLSNATGPLLKDLDNEMPAVAWDLLPMERYRAHNWHCFDGLVREPYAAIYTTLGCPYHCEFCCIQAPFKDGEKESGYKAETNSYRFWSPEVVMKQIDTLVKDYGVRNIKFADEMFVLTPKHVLGLCDLIIERGYDLNIWAYARVDTVQPNMIAKLKQAGFNWLAFGIESGNARVRDGVNKGIGQADIFETLEAVREAGIHVIGNYIFGLPEDDLDSMKDTLDLAIALNCEFANFYCTMAYPGSPLYSRAEHEGWKLPEAWSGYSQHSTDSLPLPTKYCSASEVIRFRDNAFQVYYNNPKYLESIRVKFGQETAQHIRDMASHKLVRDNV